MRRKATQPARPGEGERGWTPPRYGRGFRVSFAYPGPYRAGMSSLGFQTVLYGLASLGDVLVARVFLDERKGELVLLDGAYPPGGSDLLAFSIASENDYENVLAMLGLAGIPLRAAQRRQGHPFVIAGGIAPSLNPEPLAEFCDALVIGEGEEALEPLVEALRSGKPGREARRQRLAEQKGIYVPALYRPSYGGDGTLASLTASGGEPAKVARLSVGDLDRHETVSRMSAPGSEFEKLFLVEVNRGCGRGCRFCAAGHLLRPLRHRSPENILAAAEKGMQPGQRCGLLGSAAADHPGFLKIMERMAARGWSYSVSSLRIDRATEECLSLLAEGGCRTVTFAPETGSERLRRAVGKRIEDGQILQSVEAAAKAGIPNVRLYFMIGLPTEEEKDREAIPGLLRRIRHRVVAASRSRGTIGTIGVSLSCFVPKAWTPFQWHPFADLKGLKAALSRLKGEIKKIPNVTVTHDLPKWAYVQALLSRADRRGGDILERTHRLGGDWASALRESPVNPDFFVYRPRPRSELLPWDFISTGLAKDRLWREYRRAMEAE